ncbi:MAG: hypothetical protein JNJ43_07055 [Anaerolineales bacterium]|nr:hypothetical protein [Anaerolineales bacterium]
MNKKNKQFILSGIIWTVSIWAWTYIYYYHPGLGTTWVKEPLPHENIISLKLGETGEVIFETADGKLFEFTKHRSEEIWTEVTEPSGIPATGGQCKPGNPMYAVIPPPGQVKLRVNETCSAFETGIHLEFVILENNEIWSWVHSVYGYTHILKAFCLGGFGFLGVLLIVIGLLQNFNKIHKEE